MQYHLCSMWSQWWTLKTDFTWDIIIYTVKLNCEVNCNTTVFWASTCLWSLFSVSCIVWPIELLIITFTLTTIHHYRELWLLERWYNYCRSSFDQISRVTRDATVGYIYGLILALSRTLQQALKCQPLLCLETYTASVPLNDPSFQTIVCLLRQVVKKPILLAG